MYFLNNYSPSFHTFYFSFQPLFEYQVSLLYRERMGERKVKLKTVALKHSGKKKVCCVYHKEQKNLEMYGMEHANKLRKNTLYNVAD